MTLLLDNHSPDGEAGRILAKAAVRAAEMLGIGRGDLAGVLRIDRADVSAMERGDFGLSGDAFRTAAFLVRVFRSLDAVTGGDRVAMRSWMQAENRDLGDVPGRLVSSRAGLERVMNYLDDVRAPV